MNAIEFVEKLGVINANRKILLEQEYELREKYIEENKEFNVGEKVKVISEAYEHLGMAFPRKERYAYINSIRLDNYGRIRYRLLKSLKSGEPSKIQDYQNYNERLEKIEL